MIKRILLCGAIAVAPLPALAQQGGGVGFIPPVTNGHCVEWFASNLIEDAGGTCSTGGGNATFTTTTGNTASDIVAMLNTTTGIQDAGAIVGNIGGVNLTGSTVPTIGIYKVGTGLGFSAATTEYFVLGNTGIFGGAATGGPELLDRVATGTVTTFAPNNTANNAGIGAVTAGDVTIIASNGTGGSGIDTADFAFNLTTLSEPTTLASATIKMSALATAAGTSIVCSGTGGLLTIELIATTCSGSALRFKRDINYMPPIRILSEVLGMKPVSFRYKPGEEDGGKDIHYGMIAEDMQKAAPELVVYEKDGQTHGIKYGELSAYFVAAIKGQQWEITALIVWNLLLTGCACFFFMRRK